jgi:SAM-dependent methyltransferase
MSWTATMQTKADRELPSQFYSGLVAELYEPLAGELARADQYAPFLDMCGTPALELACGSGLPLIELIERGYKVEGLDSSSDMLDLCRSRAAESGLTPQLHLGLMQSFRLSQRYRSIFLAGASFTLLTSDEDAAAALTSICNHLESGGHALIPIETVNPDEIRQVLGRSREITDSSGNCLRITILSLDVHGDGRSASLRLRYERAPTTGEPVSVERTWERRWWTQEQFRELAFAAQFAELTFLDQTGGAADPIATQFVALARKG